MAAETGWTEAMPSPYPLRVDRSARATEGDDGWIGEDSRGVWTARHPEAALSEAEHLWEPVARFRCGVVEPSRDDWYTLSSLHLDAHLVMCAARSRALYPKPKEGSDGDQTSSRA